MNDSKLLEDMLYAISEELRYKYSYSLLSPDLKNKIESELYKVFEDYKIIDVKFEDNSCSVNFKDIDKYHLNVFINKLRDKIVWIDRHGMRHNLKDMDDDYIKNCAKLINSYNDSWREEFISIFKYELKYRKNEKLNRVLYEI
jgi:hypothetical protein